MRWKNGDIRSRGYGVEGKCGYNYKANEGVYVINISSIDISVPFKIFLTTITDPK